MSFVGCSAAKRGCRSVKDYLEGKNKERIGIGMQTVSPDIGGPEHWDVEMDDIRECWCKNKPGQRTYYHFVLSTEKQDSPNYTPEVIHDMGVKFIEKISQNGKFAWIADTHTPATDKAFKERRHEKINQNMHTHMIMNAVATDTGEKFHLDREDIKKYKKLAGDLAHEYGLKSFIDITEEKSNWKNRMSANLEEVFSRNDIFTRNDLDEALKVKGLEISRITGTGTVTYKDSDNHKMKSSRMKNFDDDFINRLMARNKYARMKEQQLQKEKQEAAAKEKARMMAEKQREQEERNIQQVKKKKQYRHDFSR